MTQLALGIWGMTLLFPHLALFGDPSPETCEVGPLVAMLIAAIIIALILVGIVGFSIYSSATNCKKNNGD